MTALFGRFRKGCRMQGDGPDDVYRALCPIPDFEASLVVTFPLPSVCTTLLYPHIPLPYEAGASRFPRIEVCMVRR